jgi:diguanylate cyclase (GGDEF)-like protein
VQRNIERSNMPKRRTRRQKTVHASGAPRAEVPGRARLEAVSVADKPARSFRRNQQRALGDEVARLEAELGALRAKVRELELRANIDPLTDIFNRRGFDRELKRAAAHVARYGGAVALIYLDLDGFKAVNDRHGHAAGDAVLQAIASTLQQSVRVSDTVARLGGDEFAVMLWNLSELDALAKAAGLENLIAALSVQWGHDNLSVGASTGVAMLSANAQLTDALAQADAAMYVRKAARRSGRLRS